MKHRPKHIIEYILMRIADGLIKVLPYRASLLLGFIVALVLHHLVRFRVTEAHERIREVFDDKYTDKEIKRIAWVSWRNLCFNAVEAARFPKMTRADFENQHLGKAFQGLQERHDALDSGSILVTIHMGNWENGHVVGELYGIPMFTFVKSQKNPLTNHFLNRRRKTMGTEVLENDKTVLRKVIRRLKDKKMLAILPDVRSPTPALSVNFLGGVANIGSGIAVFSRQTNSPILPGLAHRIGWTKHECYFFDPIYPDPSVDKKEDYQRIMQEIMDLFTEQIRQHPEQYFWYNKRWILDPL